MDSKRNYYSLVTIMVKTTLHYFVYMKTCEGKKCKYLPIYEHVYVPSDVYDDVLNFVSWISLLFIIIRAKFIIHW